MRPYIEAPLLQFHKVDLFKKNIYFICMCMGILPEYTDLCIIRMSGGMESEELDPSGQLWAVMWVPSPLEEQPECS